MAVDPAPNPNYPRLRSDSQIRKQKQKAQARDLVQYTSQLANRQPT